MATLNQVMLMGFVGDDPKVAQTKANKAMASFSLATTERGYTRPDGSTVEDRTDWHNIVFFGKPAEIIQKYVRKGSSLYVQGKIRTRSYEAADHSTRYITEVIGDNFQLLDRRQDVIQHTSESGEIVAQQAPPTDDELPF